MHLDHWTRSRTRITCLLLAAALVVLAAAGGALSQSGTTVNVAYDPVLGHYLTGPNGMTLYLFTNDTVNQSNCSGSCLANWPPLVVGSEQELSAPEGLAGELGVIKRSDTGELQVTYNGIPLYYWIRDTEVGQTTGQGVGNRWYVVNPAPTLRVAENAELGKFLIDGTGMTLYMYTMDEPNKSNCSGSCATNWPPAVISYGEPVAGPGVDQAKIGVIDRGDGAKQLTYDGKPLYGWIRDQKPGDTTGQGVGNRWYVVAP